jgi:hypothetical protein
MAAASNNRVSPFLLGVAHVPGDAQVLGDDRTPVAACDNSTSPLFMGGDKQVLGDDTSMSPFCYNRYFDSIAAGSIDPFP